MCAECPSWITAGPFRYTLAHDGEMFSEAAFFSESYHCDAIADGESEIEIHPKDALSQALAGDLGASRSFMEHLARLVILNNAA